MAEPAAEEVLAATRHWLQKVVVGLNLCPFAGPVFAADRIRFVVSEAATAEALAADLAAELQALQAADPAQVETTLLIHPRVLADFYDYNDFLDIADALLRDLGLDGVIQVASFHPDYRFAGVAADAIENFTNRSPYPMLHLLREASVERALQGVADPDAIFERNIDTMNRLGHDGWRALLSKE